MRQFESRNTVSRRTTSCVVLAAVSLAIVLAETATAQTLVQPNRVGTQVGGNRTGNQVGGTMGGPIGGNYLGGRGQSLGDGNAMGGQTFAWGRSGGSGLAAGAGNGLDANTQHGAGGVNGGLAPTDYNARNLIVTGSVPGGRGFRGSVGYGAATDFRGVLGSDYTYAFRADSALSSPAFSASAISRDRFLLAQGLGAYQYLRDPGPNAILSQSVGPGGAESSLRIDRANSQLSLGRSNWEIGADRTIASSSTTTGEPVRYVISPLRGMQIENMSDPLTRGGLSVYERARARRDISSGLATTDDYLRTRAMYAPEAPDPRRVDAKLKPKSEGDRLRVDASKSLPQSYLDIVDEVNKKAKVDQQAQQPDKPAQAPKSPLEQIRESLDAARGVKPATGDKKPDGSGKDGMQSDGTKSDGIKSDATKPDGTKPDSTKPANADANTVTKPVDAEAMREADRVKQRGKLMSVEDAAAVLRHGKTITELGRDDRRRVDELIKQGESALRDSDYFRAERRFNQAQSLASDNPLIEAGIANAQLGAGLYLSASLTLQTMFTSFPELIDAKYDRALLPKQDRLDAAIALIRQRIDRGDDAPGYGLVLAYIGHQVGDRKLVEEGLAVIKGGEQIETQRMLLEDIWLGAPSK
jgi:hypothetical protein